MVRFAQLRLTALATALLLSLCPSAYAQNTVGPGTWRDAKTGLPVNSAPAGGAELSPLDPHHAFNPANGANYFWDPDKPASAASPQPALTPDHASVPAWQLGLGYAYMHTDGEEVKNLNGVSFSAFYNINSWIGVGGEYSQLRGSTSISAGPSVAEISLRRRVLLGGIQFDFHPSDTVSISVATLAGRVRDNNKFSFDGFSDSSSASAMAYKIGVGGELRINDSWSVGVDANWTPTHFGGQWQHNYGFGAKVIWNLGQR